MIRNRSRRFLFYTVMKRRCVIIHRITRNKRNVLAPRITHGLDGKRPVRSRNRICVMYSHADFADDADFYYDTFLCPTKIRGYQKICVICVICVTLKICGFSPLDRTGRFPLTQRNPMKKIDEKKEKEGDHVFMTHPLFILPPGIRCDAWQGYDRESGASRPKFPYLLNYPRNPSHFLRCNPLLPPSG